MAPAPYHWKEQGAATTRSRPLELGGSYSIGGFHSRVPQVRNGWFLWTGNCHRSIAGWELGVAQSSGNFQLLLLLASWTLEFKFPTIFSSYTNLGAVESYQTSSERATPNFINLNRGWWPLYSHGHFISMAIPPSHRNPSDPRPPRIERPRPAWLFPSMSGIGIVNSSYC